jgi:hypothetical protein
MSFGRPTRVAFPSISSWFAQLTGALISLLRRMDRWQLAARDEPKTPEQVLAWAMRIQNSDPGFASDLRAAALRAPERADR